MAQKLVDEWAAKEKVETKVDFITSQGEKLRITIAGEAAANSGHDILALSTWIPAAYADKTEPVDDVVNELIKSNGKVGDTVEYLGKSGGHWTAVPTTIGTQSKPPCARIDLMRNLAGIDVQAMFPAGASADKELSEHWT